MAPTRTMLHAPAHALVPKARGHHHLLVGLPQFLSFKMAAVVVLTWVTSRIVPPRAWRRQCTTKAGMGVLLLLLKANMRWEEGGYGSAEWATR